METKKYRCKLKSKQQLKKIPRERWGWWIDVCPGKTLTLRKATASDLRRCSLAEGDDRNPGAFMCETFDGGSLISKEAIKYVEMDPNDI
jgi:hypothetical protein